MQIKHDMQHEKWLCRAFNSRRNVLRCTLTLLRTNSAFNFYGPLCFTLTLYVENAPKRLLRFKDVCKPKRIQSSTIYSLGPLGHLIAVPARAVGIRLLHLRVELTAVGEVVHGLEGEGGLVPGEVQREIHYEEQGARERRQ